LIVAVLAASVAGPRAAQQATTYFVADGSGRMGFRSTDPQLARWALDAWRRSDPEHLRFEASDEEIALIRLYWVEPNSGRYGEAQPLLVGGRRGAAVFIQADVSVLDEGIARQAAGDALLRDTIVYLTCLHEIGHALGLPHTRDFRDVMYFFGYGGDVTEFFGRYRARLRSRADIAAVSGLSDADVSHVRALLNPR
jgi:hypothetical protein